MGTARKEGWETMKKRALCLLLVLALAAGLAPAALAAGAGLDNFVRVNTYTDGQFADVPGSAWYTGNVKTAYELNLVKGSSAVAFRPAGNITVAETLALACRLHSIYHTGSAAFVQGSPWYQVYVDYAVEKGIISAGDYASVTAKATRAQFASILAGALPAEALPAVNAIAPGTIPDVPAGAAYGEKVYLLYNAGVLTGNNSYGTFTPDTPIQRSAVAAIVTRMADPSLRKTFVLQPMPVSSVTLRPATARLGLGESLQVTASVLPVNAADKTLTWSSSAPRVAAVDASGRVTGVGVGTAVITATAASGARATCTVTVVANAPLEAKLACLQNLQQTALSIQEAMEYLQAATDAGSVAAQISGVRLAQESIYYGRQYLAGAIQACGDYADMQTVKRNLISAGNCLAEVPTAPATSGTYVQIAVTMVEASQDALIYLQDVVEEVQTWTMSQQEEITALGNLMDALRELGAE